jgi:hypothetical protein
VSSQPELTRLKDEFVLELDAINLMEECFFLENLTISNACKKLRLLCSIFIRLSLS